MKKDNVFLGLTCLLGAISITFVSLFIWKEVASHQKQPIVNYHTVNFDTDGGSFVKSQSIEDGKTISKPKDPTKIIDEIEYTFGGWYKDGTDFDFANTPITEDITLRAHWSRKPIPNLPHTVHLNPSGGIIDGDDILTIYDGNTIPTAPIISREGYDSSKVIWYTTSDYQEGSEFIFGKTVVYTNLFLHAKWGDIVTNTVHFMDGSTELSTQEVDYKDYASYYKPTKQGSTFVNWYDSDDLTNTFDFETEIVEETYIYAKWDIIPVKTYTVTWVDYNGDILKTDDNVAEGVIPSYDDDPTVVPVRESDLVADYEFANWTPVISEVHGNQIYMANYNAVKRYDSQVYMIINLTEDAKVFKFYVATASSFSVDWGDGSSSTYEKSDYVMHTYEKGGEYKIRLEGDVSQIGLNEPTASKSSVKKVYLGSKIYSLPGNCFDDCINLEFVETSNSISSIPVGCFSNCSSLKTIKLFGGVTSIGGNAFYGCSSLTSITIPSSVTSIEGQPFINCPSLSTIKINAKNTVYTSRDKSGNECNAIFTKDCQTLIVGCKGTKIPSSVTSIGNYAFQGCDSLETITIPDTITSIGDYVFYGCSSLSSITIPSSVTSIGSRVFSNCSNLATIVVDAKNTIYTSRDKSGNECNAIFTKDCQTLVIGCKETKIPMGVTSIGPVAFYYCSSLAHIELSSTVTSIGSMAFCDCSSLTSITISNSVTSIGDHAFQNCSSLESISIPNGVTLIEQETFYKCSSLTSAIIPSSVTSINGYAFGRCLQLEKVDITAYITTSDIPTVNYTAFSNCSSNLKFHVASEEMANKFIDSGKGWPTDKGLYYWE